MNDSKLILGTLDGGRRARLLWFGVWVLTCFSLGLCVQVAQATSSDGLHVPTTTNFCGSSEVVVEITVCNWGFEEVLYDVRLEPGSTVFDCTEGVLPEHTFLDPTNFSLWPGECQVVRVLMQRPVELDWNDSVCYWAVIDGASAVWLGASLRDQPLTCLDWYFEESALFLHPLDPIVFEADIWNLGNEPMEFIYLWQIWGPDGWDTDQQVLSINGQPPEEWIFGEAQIAEGEFQTISAEVEWLSTEEYGLWDLVLVREDNFAPIASIGLGRSPEFTTDVEPSDGTGATYQPDAVTITAFPNPFRGEAALSFRLERDFESATALVVDVRGRTVRTLFTDTVLGAGAHEVIWDGRDSEGREVPAGAYWIELRSEREATAARVVRVR